MKTLLKQAMLTLASMLWLQLPALATEVATRPLRAAALVKPNLVIAVDDSNSMFAELLLNTDTGYLWWSPTNGGWDSRGIFPVDITGMNYYAILFPFDGGIPFKELPPTKQFAFARSSAYNPIYYNPDVTYAPWPFGYYASTPYSFAAANPRAARIDMIRNSTTVDLTSTVCASNIQLQNGMVVDSGQMRGNNCSYSFPFDVSYQITATESLQQYLATYWVRQTCTVAMNDPSCAYAPDGIATLKRVEIKNGATFPSGRTYEAELQNFSNWFQYYRNRRLMLKGALGSTLERVSGMRVGVLSLHDFVQPTMYDTDGTDSSSNSRAAIGKVYWYDNTSGTPTRKILKHIGDQYSSNTSMIQYACQRNNTLIATDGYPNDSSLTPPAYNQSTWGSGAPYATTEAGTLADLALSYYTLNLRPTLASGRVPSSDSDKNTNLHMNTYAMSLGARGFLWPATAVPAVSTTPYAWPAAVFGYDSRYGIDELWHATINGRGQMYLATNPTDTANGLEAAFNAMTDQVGVQSAISVSSVNLTSGDGQAYQSSYNVQRWSGDLLAYTVSPGAGTIGSTPLWSAATKLAARSWSNRVIATFDGSVGKPFTADTASVASLVNPSQAYGANGALFDYLRGNRSGEGTTWRVRTSVMGAVINASPVVSSADSVVYQTSNEGMLHAFSATTGDELWAYVPYNELASIGETSGLSYRFKTQLDSAPVLATVSGRKVLLGGRGNAGAGWYALDVTSPATITSDTALAGRVMWEFPNASTSTAVKNTIGLSIGAPKIVRIKGTTTSVALLTSGYNNAAQNGTGRLFVLNASTGAVLQTLVASAGSSGDPGLAQISAFHEDDGSVQYVYGGDERGNLWRFDLVNNTVNRLAVLADASGTAQPITTAPSLVYYGGQRIVFVGTGRLLGLTDLSATPGTQTLYGIADGGELTNPRSTLVKQVYTESTDSLTSNSVNWTTSRGWYVDLPSGEVVSTDPSIGFNALVVVTNKSAIADCSAGSRYYVIDMRSGSALTGVGYVGSTISTSDMASSMVLVRTASQSSGSSTSSTSSCGTGGVAGLTNTASGQVQSRSLNLCQAIPSRKNAWTEIRR
jgi:type IV pilus assembly protein PilY1